MTTESISVSSKKVVQQLQVSPNFAKIHCPSRLVICGPTMSGKSRFALNLIKYRANVYDQFFERILYCFPLNMLHLHHEFIKDLEAVYPEIEIVEGLPDLDSLHLTLDKTTHKLVVFDDLMQEVFGSKKILDLVTQSSHHSNISVVTISQSLFFPGKNRLTFIRNCSEKVIFHDKVDQNQLSILSRHIFPNKPNFLMDCFNFIYNHTLKSELKYLLIDASPLSELPHNCIVRSFIFPNELGHSDNKVRPVFFFP